MDNQKLGWITRNCNLVVRGTTFFFFKFITDHNNSISGILRKNIKMLVSVIHVYCWGCYSCMYLIVFRYALVRSQNKPYPVKLYKKTNEPLKSKTKMFCEVSVRRFIELFNFNKGISQRPVHCLLDR